MMEIPIMLHVGFGHYEGVNPASWLGWGEGVLLHHFG